MNAKLTNQVINNSLELEFIAYFTMHLENIYIKRTGSKNTRQRDRYTAFIAYLQKAPFEELISKYNQISKSDTDISTFTDAELKTAHRLARIDMQMPMPNEE